MKDETHESKDSIDNEPRNEDGTLNLDYGKRELAEALFQEIDQQLMSTFEHSEDERIPDIPWDEPSPLSKDKTDIMMHNLVEAVRRKTEEKINKTMSILDMPAGHYSLKNVLHAEVEIESPVDSIVHDLTERRKQREEYDRTLEAERTAAQKEYEQTVKFRPDAFKIAQDQEMEYEKAMKRAYGLEERTTENEVKELKQTLMDYKAMTAEFEIRKIELKKREEELDRRTDELFMKHCGVSPVTSNNKENSTLYGIGKYVLRIQMEGQPHQRKMRFDAHLKQPKSSMYIDTRDFSGQKCEPFGSFCKQIGVAYDKPWARYIGKAPDQMLHRVIQKFEKWVRKEKQMNNWETETINRITMKLKHDRPYLDWYGHE